jgi:hypothetical protein
MGHSYAVRPAFTPLTVALTVIGFMLFWPLGLVMLAYILWGDRVPEFRRHFAGVRQGWSREWGGGCGAWRQARSGNSAFDDYRERELRRLEEERRRLEEERRQFEAFVHNLRRARDQEEFDRFMRDRNNRPRGGSDTIDL